MFRDNHEQWACKSGGIWGYIRICSKLNRDTGKETGNYRLTNNGLVSCEEKG